MEQQKIIRAAIIVLIIILTGVGISRFFFHKEMHLESARLLPETKTIPSVDLVYGTETVKSADVSGRWWLVHFGAKSCFNSCDQALDASLAMFDQFNTKHELAPPAMAFISVDPERDNPAKLRADAFKLNSNLLGITGNNSALASLAAFFDEHYSRHYTQAGKDVVIAAGEAAPAKTDYSITTSQRIYIINDRAQFIGYFEPPYTADVLYRDLVQLMDQ